MAVLATVENIFTYYLTSAIHGCTLVADTGVVSHFRGTNMVDFDRDRDANLLVFERTGGAAANGLTVRDYFAAHMASAMYTACEQDKHADWDYQSVAYAAYSFADAMMKERVRKPKKQCTVDEAFGL